MLEAAKTYSNCQCTLPDSGSARRQSLFLAMTNEYLLGTESTIMANRPE
jgi:hypothetical protein